MVNGAMFEVVAFNITYMSNYPHAGSGVAAGGGGHGRGRGPKRHEVLTACEGEKGMHQLGGDPQATRPTLRRTCRGNRALTLARTD
jgi:hypothetical protein